MGVRNNPAGTVFLTGYVHVTVMEDCKHLFLGYHFSDLFNHVDFVNAFQLITPRQWHLHDTDVFFHPLESGCGIAWD